MKHNGIMETEVIAHKKHLPFPPQHPEGRGRAFSPDLILSLHPLPFGILLLLVITQSAGRVCIAHRNKEEPLSPVGNGSSFAVHLP